MPRRRKPGRPRLTPRGATALIQMRVEAARKRQWQAAALRSGQTLSRWLGQAADSAIALAHRVVT